VGRSHTAVPPIYTRSLRESTGEGGGKRSLVIEWVEHRASFGGKDRMGGGRFLQFQVMYVKYVKQESRSRRVDDQSEERASIHMRK